MSVVMHISLGLPNTKLLLERKIHFTGLQSLNTTLDTSSHVNQTSRANKIYLREIRVLMIKRSKALYALCKK